MLRKQDREEDEQRIKIDMLIKEGKMKEAREEAYLKVHQLWNKLSNSLKEQRNRMEAQGEAFDAPAAKKCKFGEEKKTMQIASIEIKSNQKLKILAKPVRWVQVGAVVKGFYIQRSPKTLI